VSAVVGAAIASDGGALEGGGERGAAALPNMEEGERGAAALASNVSRVRASRGDGIARALAPAPALGINLP
jgi:hypothetical protein